MPICYRHTAAIFGDNAPHLPDFQMLAKPRAEYGDHNGRQHPHVLLQEVPFSAMECPKFAKHYKLSANPWSIVGGVFTAEVMDYFARHQGWNVEVKEGSLLLYRQESLDPEDWPGFANRAMAIRRRLVGK